MRIRLAVAALLLALVLAASAPAAVSVSSDDTWHERVDGDRTDRFAVPLAGPLHSPFGPRWGDFHRGIDIAVLGTDAVRAALPGLVTDVGYLSGYSGYGHVVRIRHDGGLETLYAHLESASVTVGERVRRGQRIAYAGCTGSCTGPHLHFEVRVNGKLIDPLRYLEGRVR